MPVQPPWSRRACGGMGRVASATVSGPRRRPRSCVHRAAVGQRLVDVLPRHLVVAREVGDGPRHASGAMDPPRRHPEAARRAAPGRRRPPAPNPRSASSAPAARSPFAIPCRLSWRRHALPMRAATASLGSMPSVRSAGAPEPAVPSSPTGRSGRAADRRAGRGSDARWRPRRCTPAACDAAPATGTGVERGQQREASRHGERAVHARDGDAPALERLAQGVERIGPKLQRLVEQQDARDAPTTPRPGRTRGPPPTSAWVEMVWCGARKGRSRRAARADRAAPPPSRCG